MPETVKAKRLYDCIHCELAINPKHAPPKIKILKFIIDILVSTYVLKTIFNTLV